MTGVELPGYDRGLLGATGEFSVIGSGSIGGKSRGLVQIRDILNAGLDAGAFPGVRVHIPAFTVLATDVFDEFLSQNDLRPEALAELPDHRIALAFQQASLPPRVVGDLQALIRRIHTPLAVRSSSLLEDAMYEPFAGVYGTKMIPNDQHDPAVRFRRLVEAIKFVYASAFFQDARNYIRATGRPFDDEKMAVMIQRVVGRRYHERFYPDISGVARSYNFYPTGHARPKEGVVSLALGLGKTIVDGGLVWNYSPAFPRANPPYNTTRDLLRQTQTRFWAVRMGKPPAYDPINEAEHLVSGDLEAAEEDGALGMLASTYLREADRLVAGLAAEGARVLTFAPLLVAERLPLNRAITALLSCCEHALGTEVEIEFAVTFDAERGDHAGEPVGREVDRPGGGQSVGADLGFLQVRPLAVSNDAVDLPDEMLSKPGVLAASDEALGNGVLESLSDVVYLKRDTFDTGQTRAMATELDQINRRLGSEGRHYLLIGFGRWGTSDAWLGVPVTWGQIAGARAIVEASLPGIQPDPSQGSHFFHNVTSFRVLYFSIRHTGRHRIDWEWLDRLPAVEETRFVRHVRSSAPLRVIVDGRSGRGVILRAE